MPALCLGAVHVSSDSPPGKHWHGVTWAFGTGFAASSGFVYLGEVRGECGTALRNWPHFSCILEVTVNLLNPSLLRGAVTHVTVCLHEYVSSWAASIPNSEDINLFGSL